MKALAATRGNWYETWVSLDRCHAAKVAANANCAGQGADLLSGVAAE